jgi:hypothetical protein
MCGVNDALQRVAARRTGLQHLLIVEGQFIEQGWDYRRDTIV